MIINIITELYRKQQQYLYYYSRTRRRIEIDRITWKRVVTR